MALSHQHSRRVLKLIATVNSSTRTITASFSSLRDTTTNPLNLDSIDHKNNNNPPEPIPDRPLRSERPIPDRPIRSERPIKNPQKNINLRKDDDDNAFLEKFKLRIDDKDKKTEAKERIDDGVKQQQQQQPPVDAQEIFKKMKETGLIPNAVAMLDGLCKDGLVQEAMKLFGYMREKGTIPEVVVYTAVVEGFIKARKPDEAIRIFRKMGNNGISPNAFSFGVLIQGLCKYGCFDDAVGFCCEMVDAGYSPNVATFVGLVDGVCKEKGVDEAKNLIMSLRQKGFFVNEKSVRDYLDRNAPFSPSLWEAFLGKKPL